MVDLHGQPLSEIAVVNENLVLQRPKFTNDSVEVLVIKLFLVGHLQNIIHLVSGNVPVVILVDLLDHQHNFAEFIVFGKYSHKLCLFYYRLGLGLLFSVMSCSAKETHFIGRLVSSMSRGHINFLIHPGKKVCILLVVNSGNVELWPFGTILRSWQSLKERILFLECQLSTILA